LGHLLLGCCGYETVLLLVSVTVVVVVSLGGWLLVPAGTLLSSDCLQATMPEKNNKATINRVRVLFFMGMGGFTGEQNRKNFLYFQAFWVI